MNECLFCRLTDWLLSLDWRFLLPYIGFCAFVLVLGFGSGYILGCKDYDEIYDRWYKEKECREHLERDMGL